MDDGTYFLHLSMSSVILIDYSTESPVHVLMLSIQAVRGLPRGKKVKNWLRINKVTAMSLVSPFLNPV